MCDNKCMKYCHRFHDYLYMDHYNGDVWICPWMEPGKGVIGNIFDNTLEEIYNSDKADKLRETMDNQTFEYCRPQACPHIQNNDLPVISETAYYEKKKEKNIPTIINLAYDFVCNQSCETCRETVFIPAGDYASRLEEIQVKLEETLNGSLRVTASGHGDPFASPHMMKVLENLQPTSKSFSLLLETNGVFFDEEHWNRIKHLKNKNIEVCVTINSFDPFVYKYISRGGNYEKMLNNLHFISGLRRNGDIKCLSLSMVIQDRNFREIPSFIERGLSDEFAFDKIILKPVYQWGTMKDSVFWFKDVLNPMHPYHKEYLEIQQNPLLHDSRVYNFGGDTVHPARPYPKDETSIIPYDKIKVEDTIVVYGAGQIGRRLVDELSIKGYKIVLWIDKCGDNQSIYTPDRLASINSQQYTKVVVATLNSQYAEEMCSILKKYEINREKVVSVLRNSDC